MAGGAGSMAAEGAMAMGAGAGQIGQAAHTGAAASGGQTGAAITGVAGGGASVVAQPAMINANKSVARCARCRVKMMV